MGKKIDKSKSGASLPNDWNETTDGYCCLSVCIPNSPMWRATYRGLFVSPTKLNFWRRDMGIVKPYMAIANQVYNDIEMACGDNTQLERIGDLLETLVSKLGNNNANSGYTNDCLTEQLAEVSLILGGNKVTCIDSTLPKDCQTIALVWSSLIELSREIVTAISLIGGTLTSVLVEYLFSFRWFTRLLVVVGLATPSPIDDAVIIPIAGCVELVTAFVSLAVEATSTVALTCINVLEQNKEADTLQLCKTLSLNTTMNIIINTAVDVIEEIESKAKATIMLQAFFGSPTVAGLLGQ